MAKVWLAILGGFLAWNWKSSAAAAFSAESKSVAHRPDTADFRALLLSGAPLMDVRSPVEFLQGSFPLSKNRPLMTNDERHLVGICYKENGQDAAIELGNALVTGDTKAERIQEWTDFCRANPENGYLYCFRGGLRSNTVQDWILEETGVRYPLVEGGYKAMRRFLLDELDRSLDATTTDLVIICGRTGTGKTLAIEQLEHCSVDLEGLAHHRGSAFGRIPEDPNQPSQIDFENSVSIDFLKVLDQYKFKSAVSTQQQKAQQVFVEDEGANIGNIALPHVLKNRMKACDGIVIIEEDMENRLDVLVEDYVVDLRRRFIAVHGDDMGRKAHSEYLLGGLDRIRKKLGGDRHADLSRTMSAAFAEHDERDDLTLHRVWVAALLDQYYDPMYDYALSRREDEVLFRGDREAVVDWAMAATSNEMK